MKNSIAAALLLPALGLAFPPGAPMSEFGPSQVSVSAFFDHSGQDLFTDLSPSVLNTTGLSLDYGPWSYLQFGLFAGSTEFDVALPDNRLSDTSAHAFNTDYSFSGGASMKLASPRFANGTTRMVAYGSGTYFNNEDPIGNGKQGIVYNGGLTVQYLFRNRLNLVLGGEGFAVVGEQKSAAAGGADLFANSQPDGIVDFMRGVVGVEWFFKGKNKPFISVAFRPTGSTGWHDDLGLRNASISVSLGAMASLGKEKPEAGEEDAGLIDE